jgi:hypothetical protein
VARRIMNVRPLAVHVDAGWNSELAVANIKRIVEKLDIDLVTYVVDWDEMRELQKAFLRSGIANQDIPQDHAFAAKTYELAAKHGVRYLLTGSNLATEGILPASWGSDAMDARLVRSIFRRFGRGRLDTFPIMPWWKRYFFYPKIKGLTVARPLDLLPYSKEAAMQLLSSEYGWVYYGGKHYESRWTKFFQGYFLVKRWGYDKRRAHLASLVVSGQKTRDAALAEMQDTKALVDAAAELPFVLKKLEMSSSSA